MLIVLGVFLAVFFATRIVSLGSICAAAIFPWATLFFEIRSERNSSTLIVLSFVLALMVIWRHRANIRRLQEGTEKQLSGPAEELERARRAADQTLRDIAPPNSPADRRQVAHAHALVDDAPDQHRYGERDPVAEQQQRVRAEHIGPVGA